LWPKIKEAYWIIIMAPIYLIIILSYIDKPTFGLAYNVKQKHTRISPSICNTYTLPK